MGISKKEFEQHQMGNVLPVLSPRDLLDEFVQKIEALNYSRADYFLALADPLGHKSMSIRQSVNEPTKGPFVNMLVFALCKSGKNVDMPRS